MRIRWWAFSPAVLLAAALSPLAHAAPLPRNARADRIVVYKAKHELQLWSHGSLLKTYKVALGPNPTGHKQQEGDGRTPEGNYVIDSRNPRSQYHLSLHVSYPNAEDRRRATAAHVSPGGAIMIHGLPKQYAWVGAGHRLHDWTLGCIAVTNDEIEEIWRTVPDGTPIRIEP